MGWSVRDFATAMVAVPVLAGLVAANLWLPFPFGTLLAATALTVISTGFWLAGGGTVVGVVVWVIPVLALLLALTLWPSRPLALVLAGFISWPFAAWVFGPIAQAHMRLVERLSTWVLDHSFSKIDRQARIRLRTAGRGTPQLRADSRQLEDLPRALAAFQRHADDILAVEAPDLGWARIIRATAAPVLLYREMLAGIRPLDQDAAADAFVRARLEYDEFLRSRSVGYRLLTFRFTEPDGQRDGPSPGSSAS